MSSPVPVYPQPCMAADEDNNALYLLGVSTTGVGKLEASYVSLANINSPSIKPLGFQTNIDSWSTYAPKDCFIYPADVHPNSPVMVVQYGAFKTFMSIMTANGQFTQASVFVGTAFLSPKQFSMVGESGDFAWFVAQTNDTYPETNSNWIGVRLNFTTGLGSHIDPILSVYPTSTPLVSVGTYGTTPTTMWQGNNVVFDTQGGGYIYPTVGALDLVSHVVTQSPPTSVSMSGITLTANSVPVTMDGTGYILDKAADGSTVLYSITPAKSSTLQQVTRTGGAPPFNPSMVAVACNQLIVTYSMANTTTAYLNTFDTTTNTWAGPGLVGVPDSGSGDSSTPIGAIIGGVVGGLVLIALVAFLLIRCKRKKTAHKRDVDGHGDRSVKAEDYQTPQVYTYVPETVPAPIVQEPVFFDPNQRRATYYDPNAVAYNQNAAAGLNIYDPNANIYDQNANMYDQGLNTYETPGASTYPPPPASAGTPYSLLPPSPYQDPAMSPTYSSQATKTGSPTPANPQFVDPEAYASHRDIGSPQYVEAREYKVENKPSNEPEYYRPQTPLFTLGTYTSPLSTTTRGYSIVFDTTGQGHAYPALGKAAPVLEPQDHILSPGSPYSVNLNGATLTMDAVSATMANTVYILDKVSSQSLIYSSFN
ncbi:hypothetical protein BGX30_008006 [Mortierella sp. GBA39]|nr:hypothetical protein BGX30_008006 [Mortierella sp. GBA39]